MQKIQGGQQEPIIREYTFPLKLTWPLSGHVRLNKAELKHSSLRGPAHHWKYIFSSGVMRSL